MATPQELEVQKKRQVKSEQESTAPVNMFIPTTDIYETEAALMVVVEMPGVDKSNVDIAVKDGVLTIDGKIDFQKICTDATGLYGIQCRPLSAPLFAVEQGQRSGHSRRDARRLIDPSPFRRRGSSSTED